MKILSIIAGVLLGLIFNVVALNFFFHFFEMPAPPAGSPPAMFLGAIQRLFRFCESAEDFANLGLTVNPGNIVAHDTKPNESIDRDRLTFQLAMDDLCRLGIISPDIELTP